MVCGDGSTCLNSFFFQLFLEIGDGVLNAILQADLGSPSQVFLSPGDIRTSTLWITITAFEGFEYDFRIADQPVDGVSEFQNTGFGWVSDVYWFMNVRKQ